MQGTWVWFLGPGRSYMLRGNYAHTPQLLSPWAATTEAHVLYSLCVVARGGGTVRGLHTPTRERLQTPTHSSADPEAPKADRRLKNQLSLSEKSDANKSFLRKKKVGCEIQGIWPGGGWDGGGEGRVGRPPPAWLRDMAWAFSYWGSKLRKQVAHWLLSLGVSWPPSTRLLGQRGQHAILVMCGKASLVKKEPAEWPHRPCPGERFYLGSRHL